MILRIFIFIIVTNFAPVLQAQNWLPMYVNQDIRNFYIDTIDNVMYAGGWATDFGGKTTYNGIGIWNDSTWDTLPNKLSGNPSSICRYKNKLYVTGSFNKLPFNCPSHSLMTWDLINHKWDSVGIGIWSGGNDYGSAKMKVINNELYFYGAFDHVADINVQALNLIKFDGTNWMSLNYPSYPEIINGIAMYKGELYVYGQFTNLTGDPNMDFLVKYNGTNWVSTGANFNGAHSIESIVVYKNELYIVGYFLKSDGCSGDGIIKYDGNTWQEVNGGFSLFGNPTSIPRHLEVYNDTLYISGNFDKIGTMPAHGIVKYDGKQFCAIDNAINQSAGALAVYKNKIYMGGDMIVNNNHDTLSFLNQQNKFNMDTCQLFAVGVKENSLSKNIKIYPNPTTSIINIVDENNQLQNATIEIKDYLGQTVYVAPFSNQINISNLALGMYFLTVQDKENRRTIKAVKE
ncbi:MAG TPA: T9SS type A sorting domain-containing protein [Bacteroidia bacterium]|nr:T9SS type A sorting domain-containing protein [Bacteroidia bacterium]